MTLIAQMGALLLQGATTLPDATVLRPVASGPGWFLVFNQLTIAAGGVVFLILMVLLIPAVAKFRKTATRFEAVLDHIERSIDPLTQHAAHIADNIDYISTSIRADVQDVRRTLSIANTGIRDAIESSERRLHELGAVLRVVQEEAEQAFVSTASTLRGVRAGAATFRENGHRLASDDQEGDDDLEAIDDLEARDDDYDDDYEDLDDDLDDDLDAADDAAEDMTNGDDNGAALGRSEPRIKRPRRGDGA